MLARTKRYLEHIGRHLAFWYGPASRLTLEAYALYVRSLLGDADVRRARVLARKTQYVPLEAMGLLLAVLAGEPRARATVDACIRRLAGLASKQGETAHFVTSYGDDGFWLLQSSRRTDALLLLGLIRACPDSSLIPKLVAGLQAHRTKGRWENTQENVFVLLALESYFQRYERVAPDFVARSWIGEHYAGMHAFRGHNIDRHRVTVPMAHLLRTHASQLALEKEGAGRLYYRLGLRYALTNMAPPPSDRGFMVERTYEGADAPADVSQEGGCWQVRLGARVKVKLTLATPSRRYHVALIDSLPAGFEPLNPALEGIGARSLSTKSKTIWFEHENLRDARAEVFTSLLLAGRWTYEYLARATTPGEFVVPPPRAEEMYHPEISGRGRGSRLIVSSSRVAQGQG